MEVQVDFLGTDVALKFVLIWHLFSHDGFRIGSKLFILKVKLIYTHNFWTASTFCKKHSMHTFIVFTIAKGLPTCRLGGVISAQKVLF